MNQAHLELCSSDEWAKHIQKNLMPWVLEGAALGPRLLEVGPGPGRTTDLLRHKVPSLTAVELDSALAHTLAGRLENTNVEVVSADSTRLPFPDAHFDAAASFTMLHHVPSVELQDQLLAEVARVLRPAGMLVGVDSLDSPSFRELYQGDICVPIDPLGLTDRLHRAGFVDVSVTVWSIGTRFAARTPA